MKLSMGIVGLPNVGKSTLFKLITQLPVNIANYPFCTIDPNVGVVPVPDERLDKLSAMSKSKKKIPAIVEFYDIAGLVKGASAGEGLGNQFLSHIKQTDAVLMVLRAFPLGDIIHVENSVDPLRDLGIITTELALKDLDVVERAVKKAEGEAKTGKKEAKIEFEMLSAAKEILSSGKALFHSGRVDILAHLKVRELQLLTAKPQLFLINGTENDVPKPLLDHISSLGGSYIIADLSKEEGIPELIKKAYEVLNLISFFTTGEDESRAWTIRRGAKAPEAAGAIHSDFEKKFIRAEVVAYSDFVAIGGWSAAKQKGKLRIEGKEYVVTDGDVIEIRHG